MCFTQGTLLLQIVGTLLLITIDGFYLSNQKNFYQDILALAPKKGIRLFPGILCWFLIVAMIQALVLSRSDVQSWQSALFYGALLGLAMYGVYNTTNLATISNWTWKLALGDTAWGTILTGMMSVLLWKLRSFSIFSP